MNRRRSRVFTSGPWRPEDGDPGRPRSVLGVPVSRRLSFNPDRNRALVRLADGRYALTGETVIVGLAAQVRRFLNARARPGVEDSWLAEIRPLLRGDGGAVRFRREQHG